LEIPGSVNTYCATRLVIPTDRMITKHLNKTEFPLLNETWIQQKPASYFL